MRKVDKRTARRLWNDGKEIMIIPCKMRVNNPRMCNPWISKSEFESLGYDTDFDKIVNQHEYYNCNNETGKYCAYYVA